MSPDATKLDALKIDRSQERYSERVLWPYVLGGLLVLAFVLLYFLKFRGPAPVPISTATAQAVSGSPGARTVLNASGYVVARRRATVSSETTGKVAEVHIEEGQRVRKGELLARLDSDNLQAGIALARAQVNATRTALEETKVLLADARKSLSRTERLVSGRVATQAQLDGDQAAVDALAARLLRQQEELVVTERQVDVWRRQIEDAEIRAPFDGVVVSKDAQPGEMISPVSAGGGFTRTGIGTLVDMSSLEIEIDVNESYINRVSEQQKVVATLDAYPEWQIPASVLAIIPTADRQKSTVRVRIAIDETDPRILPDMGVKVAFRDVEGAETTAPAGATIPLAALRQERGQDIVFVVVGERLERRAVTRGNTLDQEVTISAGLQAGEKVMVEGPTDASEGMLVKEESQ